jgi:hypothetical protein
MTNVTSAAIAHHRNVRSSEAIIGVPQISENETIFPSATAKSAFTAAFLS